MQAHTAAPAPELADSGAPVFSEAEADGGKDPSLFPDTACTTERSDLPITQTPQQEQKEPPPRYVERNLPFHQSRNTVQVEHNQGWRIGKLVRYDLFHILLRKKLYVSFPLLLAIWTLAIMIFAGLYYAADNRALLSGQPACSLFGSSGQISYQGAFAFSLQTCTTVGYTLPFGSNAFFEDCPSLQTLIYLQSVWSMFFNAFLLAFLYTRVARAESRSVQLVFSDKAIVSQTPEGQFRFHVRLYDVDPKHPVVEAKCRIYAVSKDRSVPVPLRLIQPNDELGGALFLSLPCIVAHHVDKYSELHPPVDLPVETTGLALREADSLSSSRLEVNCPVCGESFGTVQRWKAHVANALRWERNGEYPAEGTHLALSSERIDGGDHCQRQEPLGSHPPVTLNDLEHFFRHAISEVVVIASAQDPLTSGCFQALQSYRFEDVVFDANASFEPCIFADKSKGRFCVDLDRFHVVRTHAQSRPAIGSTASSLQMGKVAGLSPDQHPPPS
jgi:hypothetical protein